MEISSRHTGLAAASVNHVTALGAMPYKKSDLSRLSSGPQNADSYVGATGNLSPRSAVGKIYTSDSPNTYGGGISPNDYGMGLTEVTRGGKNQIHPHRSDSNGIDRGNSGAGSSSSSSSSRMMEEWRDRDLEMNGRSNMIARGNGEGQREKSRESRETSLEREKTVIKERAGENRSSYHREQEREWEQEEIREERKERDRRERRREKEEADDFQSPRYALHTPPRRSGSLTGSASKISSITKRSVVPFLYIAILNKYNDIKFICQRVHLFGYLF